MASYNDLKQFGDSSPDMKFLPHQNGLSNGETVCKVEHEQDPTGEKPFECKQCGKCFSERFDLLYHESSLHWHVHTAGKLFESEREEYMKSKTSLAGQSYASSADNSTPNDGEYLSSLRKITNDTGTEVSDTECDSNITVAEHQMFWYASMLKDPGSLGFNPLMEASSGHQDTEGQGQINVYVKQEPMDESDEVGSNSFQTDAGDNVAYVENVSCKMKGNLVKWNCDLDTLINLHAGNTHLRCDDCGCLFRQEKDRNDHRCPMTDTLQLTTAHSDTNESLCNENSLLGETIKVEEFESMDSSDVHENTMWYRKDDGGAQDPQEGDEYKCSICNKMFPLSYLLNNHMDINHPMEKKGAVVCFYRSECSCGKTFWTKKSLQRHTSTCDKYTHTGERPFKCTLCQETFIVEDQLNHHIKIHNKKMVKQGKRAAKGKEAAVVCYYCEQEYETKEILTSHVKRYHAQKRMRFACSFCGHHFGSKKSLQLHKFTHTRPFKCTLCPKTFVIKDQLNDHIKIHNKKLVKRGRRAAKGKEAAVVCYYCEQEYETEEILTSHVRIYHSEGRTPFACSFCGRHFGSKKFLQLHKFPHTGERSIKCTLCPKTFIYKDELNDHIKIHNKKLVRRGRSGAKGKEAAVVCYYCEQEYETEEILTSHVRIYHSEGKTPFACSFCGRHFGSKKFLQLHKFTHTGERSIKCTLRPKKFVVKDQLKNHMTIHNRDCRPIPVFKCPDCDKGFQKMSTLNTHRRTHTSEKPFKCPNCAEAFKTTSALTNHKYKHFMETVFQCPKCPKLFSSREKLEHHLNTSTHAFEDISVCPDCGEVFATIEKLQCHQKSHDHANEKETRTKIKNPDEALSTEGDVISPEGDIVPAEGDVVLPVGDVVSSESDLVFPVVDKVSPVGDIVSPPGDIVSPVGDIVLPVGDIVSPEAESTSTLTVLDEKPFKCSVCEKGFTSVLNLNKHELLHAGPKPFVCFYCEKTFAEKFKLTIHERIHTGERPFKCSYCTEAFRAQDRLKYHERSHTGEKPYKCSHCEKAFGWWHKLKYHVDNHCGVSTKGALESRKEAKGLKNKKIQINTTALAPKQSPELCNDTAGCIDKHFSHCDAPFTTANGLISHVESNSREKDIVSGDRISHKDRSGPNDTALSTKFGTTGCIDKPFICSRCDAPFETAKGLLIHVNRVSQKDRSRPNDTALSTKFTEIVQEDRSELCDDTTGCIDKPFICSRCDAPFATAKGLLIHVESHSREKDIVSGDLISQKDRSGQNDTALSTKFTEIVQEDRSELCDDTTGCIDKPFICSRCDTPFATAKGLLIHVGSHSPKKIIISGAGVLQKDGLGQNKTVLSRKLTGIDKGDIIRLKCLYCPKVYTSKIALAEHGRSHQRPEVSYKPFKCQYCGKAYKDKQGLKIHERLHTGEKPYKCHYCVEAYKSKSELDSHVFTHTGERRHKCSHCQRSFAGRKELKLHEDWHQTGEYPFKCSFCEKRFTQPSSLKLHVRIHTGERPFQCSFCGKTFMQKASCIQHERTHTGEKPFQCAQCEKSFALKSCLTSHERVHTGEKPYKCSVCDETFSQKSSLNKHEKSHLGIPVEEEISFKCTHCGLPFKSKSGCQTHEQQHLLDLGTTSNMSTRSKRKKNNELGK